MSPDPPREDSGDDENRLRRFSGDFIEGIMDDQEFFIVPDAPYELDMEDESDYSDSDEESGAVGGVEGPLVSGAESGAHPGSGDARLGETDQPVTLQQRQRGRYRLLIPFTVTDTLSSEESTTEPNTPSNLNVTSARGASDHSCTPSTSSSSQAEHVAESDSEKASSMKHAEEVKREIELTDEKVETIMQVMKNITLPNTSFPKWAAEIDEDMWRKKLSDSIGTKSCANKNSTFDTDDKKESDENIGIDKDAQANSKESSSASSTK